MKKLVVIALSLFTFTGFAQKEISKNKKIAKEKLTKEMTATPKERAIVETKKLALSLDLSKNQQESIKEILVAHYEERSNKENSKNKQMTRESFYKMKVQRLDAQILLKEKMKTILNDEQYAKYSQMMERKMKNRRGKGKRRR